MSSKTFIHLFFTVQWRPQVDEFSLFLADPRLGYPLGPLKIFFSIFFCKIWTPPNLNFMDLRRQNSTYEERTPPEGSNISIFTSCSKIMLPVRKSAHMYNRDSWKIPDLSELYNLVPLWTVLFMFGVFCTLASGAIPVWAECVAGYCIMECNLNKNYFHNFCGQQFLCLE